MRHQRKGRKFGRESGTRKAFLRSLTNNFIRHGKIKTTEARAKEIRPKIEKLITRSKTDSLASRRLLARQLPETLVRKMMAEIGPRYAERKGGYLRITKLKSSRKDAAKMAIIELV